MASDALCTTVRDCNPRDGNSFSQADQVQQTSALDEFIGMLLFCIMMGDLFYAILDLIIRCYKKTEKLNPVDILFLFLLVFILFLLSDLREHKLTNVKQAKTLAELEMTLIQKRNGHDMDVVELQTQLKKADEKCNLVVKKSRDLQERFEAKIRTIEAERDELIPKLEAITITHDKKIEKAAKTSKILEQRLDIIKRAFEKQSYRFALRECIDVISRRRLSKIIDDQETMIKAVLDLVRPHVSTFDTMMEGVTSLLSAKAALETTVVTQSEELVIIQKRLDEERFRCENAKAEYEIKLAEIRERNDKFLRQLIDQHEPLHNAFKYFCAEYADNVKSLQSVVEDFEFKNDTLRQLYEVAKVKNEDLEYDLKDMNSLSPPIEDAQMLNAEDE